MDLWFRGEERKGDQLDMFCVMTDTITTSDSDKQLMFKSSWTNLFVILELGGYQFSLRAFNLIYW